ncbi:uncharacterized protein [Polyergus mexicanus]|uniref:uncharacterized protein n=1 Tax=Polyergus mexicanus TaxID=615972 RepID=UPI0038B64CAF
MNRRSRYLHCWPEDLREDEPCAIQIKNLWQRGLIIGINTATAMVKISLRDWGLAVWKPMSQVYFLEDRFRELPWQSIKCGLAHTGPVNGATKWPEKTRLICKILGDRQEGWIRIIHPLGEREAMVKLTIYNENTEGAYNLRDSLIQLGHARLIDDVATSVFPHL